jgi:hypothetical protein
MTSWLGQGVGLNPPNPRAFPVLIASKRALQVLELALFRTAKVVPTFAGTDFARRVSEPQKRYPLLLETL